MQFSSIPFIYGFIPLSVAVYHLIPERFKKLCLLIISAIFIFFFGVVPAFAVIVFSIISYFLCMSIKLTQTHKIIQGILLAIEIIVSLFFIVICKYDFFKVFFDATFCNQLRFIGSTFFAMSAIAVASDICNGESDQPGKFIDYFLYMLYFPKIFAGPYISLKKFCKRQKNSEISLASFGEGMCLFIKGLAKKIIISDNLIELWSAVQQIPSNKISALTAWLGIISYSLSFYFTLSGISDMASGISLMFGIRLPSNFSYPIFSMGINEFCMRWHTTVAGWLRRYLYRFASLRSQSRVYKSFVYVLVWCAFGALYQASTNKIIWGFIIGFSAIIEKTINKKHYKQFVSIIYTVIVASISWTFFMSDNVMNSLMYIKSMIGANNLLVDEVGVYFFRSYIVLILVSIYASTDLFNNLIERSKKKSWSNALISAVTIPINIVLLIMCTASIIYTGVSKQPLILF